MIKIIWILNSINIIALVCVAVYFMMETSGRNVDPIEKGWTMVLAGLFVLIILSGIIPIRLSKSTFCICISVFFAALPSFIAIWIFINNKLSSFEREKSFAAIYYDDKTPRAIASAIEQNDTTKLKELIKGQNLNIQGNKVYDMPGLNYLQFAIRLRNSNNFALNDEANLAIIAMLVKAGSATAPALIEAIRNLPPNTFSLLLDAGALKDSSKSRSKSLLFDAIGTDKQQNDNAILLIKKGVDVNAVNSDGLTAIMYTAQNASTTTVWNDAWRVVRFLLEEGHADYTITKDNITNIKNFGSIISGIRIKAAEEGVTMCPDFIAITEWLKKHDVITAHNQ